VRELKARLSEVLRAVQRGEPVRITSRGRPVAEIVPPRPRSYEERLAELIASGTVTAATDPWPPEWDPPADPQPDEPLPSEVILAERESYRW